MADQRISTAGVKALPNREEFRKSAEKWIENRSTMDGAEGLWRVHDNIYDLTDFVAKHPGGEFWLEATKGLDITEAFESHHISTKPEAILKKYYVRKAKTKRVSPFTFEENGFYRTVKRNVREVMDTIPKDTHKASHIIIDSMLATVFILSVLSCMFWSYKLGILAGFILGCTAIAAHNYFHQKDNFRMYYSYIAMMSTREWRIIHIISHHLFPNTVADMQAFVTEPIINIYPENKSIWLKYATWIYGPLVFWPLSFIFVFVLRIYHWLFEGYSKSVCKADLLLGVLPLTMYIFGGQGLLPTIGMWLIIICIHSFWFAFMANATTHFHPDIFVDGDTGRPEHEKDWGIHQLDTVSDKHEVTGSHFLVMLTFGDHALHHLFPTLDHAVLPHLYPVVLKTMKEFNLNIRFTTYPDLIVGYFKQLAKEKPNPNPPNLFGKGKSLRYQ